MKAPVGIDIGHDSLKCATPRGVWRHRCLPERRSYRDRLAPAQWESRVAGLLRKASRECPGWGQSAVVALQGFGCRVGYLELPRLREAQLDTAVRGALARELPRGLQDTMLSYLEVPLLEGERAHRMGLLWAASPKLLVSTLAGVVRQAGLQLERCEPTALSLVRALACKHHWPAGSWNVAVNVGYELTTVTLARDQVPYFSRTFWLGGGSFTKAAMQGYGCGWHDAEERKLAYDVRQRDPVFECSVTRWLTELRRCQLYARSRAHYFGPRAVYLTGGSAQWTGLAERLSESFDSLNVVVDTWDGGDFSIATGLTTPPGKGRL